VKRIAVLAALAAFAAPGAAFAATDIGCIAGKLGPETMARIGDKVVALSDKIQPFDSALDDDREALIAARDACRQSNGWSNEATALAINYFKSDVVRVGAERALAGDGFSMASLKARYQAMADIDRKSLTSGREMSATVKNVLIALVGTVKLDEERRPIVARRLTLFFAALSALEFYPAEFTAL